MKKNAYSNFKNKEFSEDAFEKLFKFFFWEKATFLKFIYFKIYFYGETNWHTTQTRLAMVVS